MVKVAVAGYAIVMVLLLGLNLAGVDSLALLLSLLFVGYGFLGLVVPSTAVLAPSAAEAIIALIGDETPVPISELTRHLRSRAG